MVIPLGLITAQHDRQDFRNQAASTARSLGSVAEEKVGDHDGGRKLAATIAQLRDYGDQVAVYRDTGSRIAGTGPAVAASSIRQMLAGEPTLVRAAGSSMLVPVSYTHLVGHVRDQGWPASWLSAAAR